MSGAGNDFVVVDRMNETAKPGWIPVIPAMCDRPRGIGADGVILISPAENADFTMDYFNADGSSGRRPSDQWQPDTVAAGWRCPGRDPCDRAARDASPWAEARGRGVIADRSPARLSARRR